MGNDENKEQTKHYKIEENKHGKRKTKKKKDEVKYHTKVKKKHSKLKKFILILFILIFLAVLGGVGVFAGIFFSDRWAITKSDLIANGNSEVYDSKEKQLALLSDEDGDSNRKVISLNEMGKFTANAYIAIEDKRFYEHEGVDILRTGKATLSYILNKGSSDVGGGSTITQQLVKNIMKDKADTGTEGIERKIREMSRAYHIESILEKDEILEKYLNVIFIGGNNLHGVEYGAKYYFAKSAKDLDLAESAFLAGINHAPNLYDPYDEDYDPTELIEDRTKLVLNFMKEQNRISEDLEESEKLYNEAIEKVEKGFKFKKGKFEFGSTSYFVSCAIDEAAHDLAEAKDIDFLEAKNMIKSGGYKLYTTQDTTIQNRLIKEMNKDAYVEKKTVTEKDENGKNTKVTYRSNAAMTIIKPSTGQVVALAGDLQQDQGDQFNYATSTSRQTGSSIKPLANVAPGLEEKIITASTIYDDSRTKFKALNHIPQNAGGYQGLCTVRKSIETSSNIVNLKIMHTVGNSTAIKYLKEFGLDTYTEEADGITLAIGGATHGSSTLQMAAAYACLANKGNYIEPTFYKELKDSEGNLVVKPTQDKRRVISEANAYIISDILTDVVTGYSGTARKCAISGMDVAAKTGTTESGVDKWLCGYTTHYAAASWYGYGHSNQWSVNNDEAAKTIWANVMKDIHEDLEKTRFKKPDGIVTAKVCKTSGGLATSKCKSTYSEFFVKGTVPKACAGHVTVKLCKTSKKVATAFCEETEEKVYTAKPEKENNVNWSVLGTDKYKVPTDKCTVHTEANSTITVPDLIGKTEAQAKVLLTGLNVSVFYETHGDKTNGTVIRQSLAKGTKVQKGVNIIITVNKIQTLPPSQNTTTNQNPTTNQNTVVNNQTTTNSQTTNTQTNTVTPPATNEAPTLPPTTNTQTNTVTPPQTNTGGQTTTNTQTTTTPEVPTSTNTVTPPATNTQTINPVNNTIT